MIRYAIAWMILIGFLVVGCNWNDPLASLPNRSGDGTYSNLRAHNDADSGDEDPAALDLTTSTSAIRGWNAS